MKHTHPLLTLPSTPEQAHEMAARLIAHHRGTFGDARMEDDEDDPPAGGDGGSGGSGGGDGEPKLNEHGYPDKTPVDKMPAEQQAAYWKHHARKHESAAKSRQDYDAIKKERDDLKAAGMTEDQKAVEAAKKEAADAARAEERSNWSGRTVRAELRAALKGKVKDDALAAILDPINPQHFLTDAGEVDTDKVTSYASGFGGAHLPDMGQGNRGGQGPGKGIDAGREMYTARSGGSKKST